MFTATLFLTAPTQRQPICPSAGARLDTCGPSTPGAPKTIKSNEPSTRNNLGESPEDSAERKSQPKGHIHYTYLHTGSLGQARLELNGSLRHRFLSLNTHCPLHTPRLAEAKDRDTEGRRPITWVFDGSSGRHPTLRSSRVNFQGFLKCENHRNREQSSGCGRQGGCGRGYKAQGGRGPGDIRRSGPLPRVCLPLRPHTM